ncbi:MAG: methyltransferase domain-containing protein, partial [Cyanobacteria bacterium]|nr:methyltransferase domain-containing protein [Cyanobacteriota bacterium]
MPEFDFLKDAEKAFNRLTGKKPPKHGKGQKAKDRNPKDGSPKDGSNASQKFPKQNSHANRGKLLGGAGSGKAASGKEEGLEGSALYLEARRFKAKRSYSQNFLIDAGVLSRMVARLKNNNRPEPAVLVKAAEEETVYPEPQEVKLLPLPPVLEIGPGLGFLTQLLIQEYPDVTAVELDPDMVGYMRKKFLGVPNLTLVQQDILRFDFDAYPPETFQLVGNLPYNITSPILFKLLG